MTATCLPKATPAFPLRFPFALTCAATYASPCSLNIGVAGTLGIYRELQEAKNETAARPTKYSVLIPIVFYQPNIIIIVPNCFYEKTFRSEEHTSELQ